MNQHSLFYRVARYFLICTVLAISISITMFAGVTGKISGRVVDAANNEGLPSVNVMIANTSLGAVTDVDGYYFIINVPPGIYTVSASMVGYEKLTKTGVNVEVDRTATLNFAIKTNPVEGEETVVVGEKEIVKLDVSSSEITVKAEQVEVVPMVKDVMSYVNMQAGIRDNEIREGGMDQIGFMVNGLVSVDNRSNRPLMQVNLSTMSEVSIIKGGFNAEYGNIRSGLINVTTKNPDPKKFNASIDFRYAPARYKHAGEPITSPNNYYNYPYVNEAVCYGGMQNITDPRIKERYMYDPTIQGWTGWTQYSSANKYRGDSIAPEQWRKLFIYQHALEGSAALGQKEIKYGNKPDIFMDFMISGGVPFIGDKLGDLAYLISYSSNYDAYALPTFRDYYHRDNLNVKLVSKLGAITLGVEGSYGEVNSIGNSTTGGTDNGMVGSGGDIFNLAIYDIGTGHGQNFILAWWPQVMVPYNRYSSMVGFSLDHMINKNTFYNLRASYVMVKNSALGWGDDALRDTTKRYNAALGVMVDEAPWGYWIGSATETNAGNRSSRSQAYGGGQRDRGKIGTFNLKFDITSQLDRRNQVKAGFEMVYDNMITEYENNRYDAYRIDDFKVKWAAKPYRWGAYIQDKLEYEGLIANVGIRIDHNNPNSNWFDKDKLFSKYFSPDFKDSVELLMNSKPKGKLKISPRIGVSHPITEDVKLYFSYGHFYSMPTSGNMYAIRKGTYSQGVTSIGNPEIEIPRTIAYELGVDYNLAGKALLHLAGFYKNVSRQPSGLSYTGIQSGINYSSRTNNNYEDIRGFEVQIERNQGPVTGNINFTYQTSTSGTVGKSTIFEDPVRNKFEGIASPNVDDPQIRPFIRANIAYRTPLGWGPEIFGILPFEDFLISPSFSWRSGNYTTYNYGTNLFFVTPENNLKWQDTWSVDLRLSRRFKVSNVSVEIFADINNVLNNLFIEQNDGFNNLSDGGDKDMYFRTLHLPIYADPKYDDERAMYPGQFIPGNDRLGELRSEEKPYIHNPSRDFLLYRDLRYVTFGLKINL